MAERVRSGIVGLDDLIQGGFREKSIVMVSGDSGSGKSTFAAQFLHAGARSYGDPGMYISFEEPKSLFYENMRGFGFDFEKLEKEKKIAFLEYPPQEIDHFMAQEVIVHDVIDELGIRRVVIDSITSFALLYETAFKRRQEVTRLLAKLRKWGCTVLLTSECATTPQGMPKPRFGIETVADGLIYLYAIRKGDARVRALEVAKLRGTDFEPRLIPMRFTKEGIAIYPKEHVYEGFK
ncbi:MAG: ATPase domain-containing protein [Candidatus Micrarchaeia archaeon]